MKQIIVAIFLALVLAGCAAPTEPEPPRPAEPTPMETAQPSVPAETPESPTSSKTPEPEETPAPSRAVVPEDWDELDYYDIAFSHSGRYEPEEQTEDQTGDTHLIIKLAPGMPTVMVFSHAKEGVFDVSDSNSHNFYVSELIDSFVEIQDREQRQTTVGNDIDAIVTGFFGLMDEGTVVPCLVVTFEANDRAYCFYLVTSTEGEEYIGEFEVMLDSIELTANMR